MSSLMRHDRSRLTGNREPAADKPDWARRPRLGAPGWAPPPCYGFFFSVSLRAGQINLCVAGQILGGHCSWHNLHQTTITPLDGHLLPVNSAG